MSIEENAASTDAAERRRAPRRAPRHRCAARRSAAVQSRASSSATRPPSSDPNGPLPALRLDGGRVSSAQTRPRAGAPADGRNAAAAAEPPLPVASASRAPSGWPAASAGASRDQRITNAAASSTTPGTSDRMMTAPVACAAAVAKNARVSMRRFLFLFFQCGSGKLAEDVQRRSARVAHSARAVRGSPAVLRVGTGSSPARAAHRAKTVSRTSTPRKLRSRRTAAAATHHCALAAAGVDGERFRRVESLLPGAPALRKVAELRLQRVQLLGHGAVASPAAAAAAGEAGTSVLSDSSRATGLAAVSDFPAVAAVITVECSSTMPRQLAQTANRLLQKSITPFLPKQAARRLPLRPRAQHFYSGLCSSLPEVAAGQDFEVVNVTRHSVVRRPPGPRPRAPFVTVRPAQNTRPPETTRTRVHSLRLRQPQAQPNDQATRTMVLRWRTTVSIAAKDARCIAAQLLRRKAGRSRPGRAHAACALVKLLAYASRHHRAKIVQARLALKPLVELLRDGAEARRTGLLGRRGRRSKWWASKRHDPGWPRSSGCGGLSRSSRYSARRRRPRRRRRSRPSPRTAGVRAGASAAQRPGGRRRPDEMRGGERPHGARRLPKVRLESLDSVESRFFRIVTPSA